MSECEEVMAPRSLFGGAIELGIPERFVDVSEYRPVPDNQEVVTLVTRLGFPSGCCASHPSLRCDST